MIICYFAGNVSVHVFLRSTFLGQICNLRINNKFQLQTSKYNTYYYFFVVMLTLLFFLYPVSHIISEYHLCENDSASCSKNLGINYDE